MAATEKALLKDVLDCLSGVHQYLLQDLANERLSTQNQQKRQQHMQVMNGLIQKIQSSHPSIRPRMNTPGKITALPPKISPKPPPPVPVEEEEPQEVYEVPENPAAENYLSFEPQNVSQPPTNSNIQQDNDSQEEYLAMEADEDRIEEETYEEPQKLDEEEPQDLYEEAIPLPVEPPTPTVTSPPAPTSSKPFEPAGYMDPQKLTPADELNKRASIIPDDMGDWEMAYDQSNTKKKEKIKAANLKNIVVKGWLEKLGGRNQTSWQKRYCVLAGVFMYFYEKETGNTYNNRVPMMGFMPNPVPSLTRPKRKEFAFKLSSVNNTPGGKKDYYFRAKSEEECTSWIEEIRKTGDAARGVMEKRKSMTLPARSQLQPQPIPEERGRSVSSISEEQENYEALDPITEPQEDYVDVTPGTIEEPQEDYVDLTPVVPNILEEEPQEDYIEAIDIKPQIPGRPSVRTTPQMPLPPPPQSNQPTNRPGVPPPVSTVQPTHRPAVPRPDPVVDTTRVYEQNGNNNGIEYKNVYVILWDFMTQERDEVSLRRGDLVLVPDATSGQEWWFGELLDEHASRKVGRSGLFPSSYSSNAFELITAS